jgi:hypothetical protein
VEDPKEEEEEGNKRVYLPTCARSLKFENFFM